MQLLYSLRASASLVMQQRWLVQGMWFLHFPVLGFCQVFLARQHLNETSVGEKPWDKRVRRCQRFHR